MNCQSKVEFPRKWFFPGNEHVVEALNKPACLHRLVVVQRSHAPWSVAEAKNPTYKAKPWMARQAQLACSGSAQACRELSY